MNRKIIPLVLMLTAGAITGIITFPRQNSINEKLFSLLIVLLIFYFLGSMIQWTLDKFEQDTPEKE